MEEQFVPYELAVKLKELGFDESTFGSYEDRYRGVKLILKGSHSHYVDMPIRTTVKAHLWQQAFDWLREKYELTICIHVYKDGCYNYSLIDKNEVFLGKPYRGYYSSTKFKTYEQARQASLEKLIELITK